MPRIQAFNGIHPESKLAASFVVELENYTIAEARAIRERNPYSCIHLLVPKIDNPYQMGSKTELAYRIINANFEDFLNKGVLEKDLERSFYIYQIQQPRTTHTGIWTTTSIDDYLDNTVKRHELTFQEREKKLVEYLQYTGIDTNPVLITYSPDIHINRIISLCIKGLPFLQFKKDQSVHRLWKICDAKIIEELIGLFSCLPSVYIADGHHRAAAATTYALERRENNLKDAREASYNFFSSVYMATDQVRVFEFNRLVKDLAGYTAEEFLEALKLNFTVKGSLKNRPVKPKEELKFGMYLKGEWYELSLKQKAYEENYLLEQLNVEILQDLILDPLLKIKNSRNDPRISFLSGRCPIHALAKEVDQGKYAVVFTLSPIPVAKLISVADRGLIMPPKSTYFEPKFFLGLLTHLID